MVVEKTLESPMDTKEIDQSILKEISPEYSLEGLISFRIDCLIFLQSILKEIHPGCSLVGLMLKLKLQHFGHLTRRAEKGTTEDEMAGWHHRLSGHGFG